MKVQFLQWRKNRSATNIKNTKTQTTGWPATPLQKTQNSSNLKTPPPQKPQLLKKKKEKKPFFLKSLQKLLKFCTKFPNHGGEFKYIFRHLIKVFKTI